MSRDVKALDRSLAGATKRTWAHNQALFTLRRFTFYGTLGIIGLGAAVAKLGFNYYNTTAQARAAFQGFLPPKQVKKELNELYLVAARTPFEFPDIVGATRRLLPFIGNLQETNQVIGDITNSLSAAGYITPQYLNRATIAIAHMYTIGRLTGQVLYNMSRDNIPMQKALEHAFNMTGAQVRDLVHRGLVPAQVAAAALHKEMMRPGFRGAAMRQANQTLTGAFSTFKDILAIGAGTAETGFLEGLRKKLKQVNMALVPPGKSLDQLDLSLTHIALVLNKQFSPSTNAIINTFMFLEGVLKGVIGTFYVLAWVIGKLLWPFDKLTAAFGHAHAVIKDIGIVVGILTALIIVQRVAFGAVYTAVEAYRAVLLATKVVLRALNIIEAENTAIKGGQIAAYEALTARNMAATGAAVKSQGVFMRLTRQMLILFGAEEGAATAMASVWLGVIALVVLIIGSLVILYFKWKPFHDLVNRTFKWIWTHADQLAAALIIGFGPIGVAAGGLLLIVRHLHQIIHLIKQIGNMWHKIPPWLRHAITFGIKFGGGQAVQSAYSATGLRPMVSAASGGGGFWGATKRFAVGQGESMIPFYGMGKKIAGWFQQGGIVPGPIGAPQLVVAHGGEKVTPIGQAQWDRANDRPIHVHVMVDRREIAAAVARANQDYASRR